jgi:hypothetical protein
MDVGLLPLPAGGPVRSMLATASIDPRPMWRVTCDVLLAFFGTHLQQDQPDPCSRGHRTATRNCATARPERGGPATLSVGPARRESTNRPIRDEGAERRGGGQHEALRLQRWIEAGSRAGAHQDQCSGGPTAVRTRPKASFRPFGVVPPILAMFALPRLRWAQRLTGWLLSQSAATTAGFAPSSSTRWFI